MIRKTLLVAAGLGGFVVAGVLVTILSSVVSALIPGASPDQPGKMEPSIEEKYPKDNKQENNSTTAAVEQPSTAVEEPKSNESPSETPVPAPASLPVPSSAVERAPVLPPPPPVSGPGNFDVPAVPSYGGGQGPGNM